MNASIIFDGILGVLKEPKDLTGDHHQASKVT